MPITYTNKHNLPAALATTISRDEKHSVGSLSVTQLLAPPRIRRLLEQHTVEVDVADRLWATIGKGLHAVLATHGKNSEMQLVGKLGETWISGTIDAADDGVLRDWKVTSVRAGARAAEWEQQLNCYSWLMQKATLRVDGNKLVPHTPSVPQALEVTAIYRDWIGARAVAEGYPASQSETFPIKRWDVEEAERFLAERLAVHLAANAMELPPLCSDAERWHRQDIWAVRKNNNKRAMKGGVHTSEESARLFAEHQNIGGLVIEHRPGADVRCESYCLARSVCPHGIQMNTLKNANNEPEEQPA